MIRRFLLWLVSQPECERKQSSRGPRVPGDTFDPWEWS